MGMMFVKLKDWKERVGSENSAQAIAARAFGPLMGGIREAIVVPIVPPAVMELETPMASLPIFRLAGQTHQQLLEARNTLLGLAAQSSVYSGSSEWR